MKLENKDGKEEELVKSNSDASEKDNELDFEEEKKRGEDDEEEGDVVGDLGAGGAFHMPDFGASRGVSQSVHRKIDPKQ